MKLKIVKPVKSDLGYLIPGELVEVDSTLARHYIREGIATEADHRQTKVIVPERTKRPYTRRK